MDPLLVSIHIPKTAGSTLAAVLARQYGPRLQLAYQPPRAGVAPTDSDGAADVADPLCIHGHDVDRFLPLIRARPRGQVRWVTFVRDPLAGAVSLWHYRRRHAGWPGKPQAEADAVPERALELNEYLRAGYNHNRYTKWLDRLGVAESELSLIGVVERFDESIARLAAVMGWGHVSYDRRNVGGYQAPTIAPAVVVEFREANAADYALHDRASARLG